MNCEERIVATFAREGFACAAERHLGDKANFSFAEVSVDALMRMTREVTASRPQAISIFCTNRRGAPLVPSLEAELGVPIYDTMATAVWASLRATGVDPAGVRG